MATRSTRISEQREKDDLSCNWELFSILQSCEGLTSSKLISNGWPLNRKNIADHPRELDRLSSFDEECRKIHNETDLGRDARNRSSRSVGDPIQEDTCVERHKTKDIITGGQQHTRMDSELVDHRVKSHKRARKKSQKASLQSLSRSSNAASLAHLLPSASAEISLNKPTVAALLGAVSAQNHQEESLLSEYFQKSIHLGKDNQVDQISMRQLQMSAKAFVDQMFIGRKLICKQGRKSESTSFSNALEVLNSNKDLFMDLLQDPKSQLSWHVKEETIEPVLDVKLSEYKSLGAVSSVKPESALATKKGKMSRHSWQKIDHQCLYSPRTSCVAQPSNKIVILKLASQNAKHLENATCHRLSVQSHRKLSGTVSEGKPASFSFREMRKKLKQALGGTRKLPSQLLKDGASDVHSCSRSTHKVSDDRVCCRVDTSSSFNSATNASTNGKLCKKQELNAKRGPNIAHVTDTMLEFSSDSFSKKHEFDVILEAKRHLSARLKNLNDVDADGIEKSVRTLRGILASSELDLWPLSPGREVQYHSGSEQMRFSSPRVAESSSKIPSCLIPLRPNTVGTSSNGYRKYDDTKKSSQIPSTDEGDHETYVSVTDNKKSNGESKIKEMNPKPDLHISDKLSEISSDDVTRTMQVADTIKSHSANESARNSMLDSTAENDVFTLNLDDFPSTPLSFYQSEPDDSIKYQEHQSPVSVLGSLQTDRQPLKPLNLNFEEHSSESYPNDVPTSASSCIEEKDHLSDYVHLVLQASGLNWEQLSEIRSLPEKLLCASLFNEVEFWPTDCYFDPKLLFDHINEVLLEIQRSHFCSPPWLALTKPKIMSVPLEELVSDEIMTEADFYLLPRTVKRTLDQLVSKDLASCRSWLDVRLDTEQIVVEISEDVMEECILDMLLESLR